MTDPRTLASGTYQYRLVAFNTGNAIGLADVHSDPFTIVVGAPAPEITFSAIPESIRAGQSATLAWRVENATAVAIGDDRTSPATQPLSGAITVSPNQTTTYTLYASGSQLVTASVTVQVITAPAVAVSSLPAAMVQAAGGGGATTSYTLTNAGGAASNVTLSQVGSFFTQSPAEFQLAAALRRR